jgi:hypothetical protein
LQDREVNPMDEQRRGWKDRLLSVYYAVVGVFGIGRPVVDRRTMYGDDPANDPYSIEYDPKKKRDW